MRTVTTFLLFICFSAISFSVNAATLTVTNTNDSGAGSLRQAIIDAADGDEINFSLPGSGPWTIQLSSQYGTISKNLTFTGKTDASQITIRSDGSFYFFIVDTGQSVAISGLTFENAGGSWGAIYVRGTLTMNNVTIQDGQTSGILVIAGGSLSVADSQISGNSTATTVGSVDMGGGIYLKDIASASVTNTVISGNSAALNGGGIYFENEANTSRLTLTLSGCTFNSNTADNLGGAVYLEGRTSLTASNSLFTSNSAPYGGGAIEAVISTTLDNTTYVELTGCEFKQNEASGGASGVAMGGAIEAPNGTVKQCSFSGNSAAGHGGAIATGHFGFSIFNSTFALNHSIRNGGALYVYGSYVDRYTSLLYNTFASNYCDSANTGSYNGGAMLIDSGYADKTYLKGNLFGKNLQGSTGYTLDEIYGTVTSQGYNIVSAGNNLVGMSNGVNNDQVGSAALPIDIKIGNLTGSPAYYPLLSGSPAINAGEASAPSQLAGVDQRGEPRPCPEGTNLDVGAYEDCSSTGHAPLMPALNLLLL